MRKVGGALVTAALVLSVGLIALPAGAAAGPQCGALTSKASANGKTTVITLSKCTPTTATGGSGGGTFVSSTSKAGTLNVTVTWAAKHGTTKGSIKFATASSLGKCGTGTTTRFTITGSVTGGTGTAVKTIKAGQKITASVCSGKSLTLEPKTVLTL